MKFNIHPNYRQVLFHDTAINAWFLIGSTVETDKVHTHSDGNLYPYVALDVSSASHPVYTHQVRKATADGRITEFEKRYAVFGARQH